MKHNEGPVDQRMVRNRSARLLAPERGTQQGVSEVPKLDAPMNDNSDYTTCITIHIKTSPYL